MFEARKQIFVYDAINNKYVSIKFHKEKSL